MLQNGRIKTCRLHRIELHTAQTKSFGGKALAVTNMLNEIEDENLYRALLTVDKRTLQIVLLKMQGYSLKEIAPMVDLSAGAVYARLDHLRKKLRKLL